MPREPLVVTVVVEGLGDEPLARRILHAVGLSVGPVFHARGKPRLDARLPGYNNAARTSPWLVLRDLDNAVCAPALRAELLPQPSRHMCFRIAVRSAEAWLMADREALATFLAVPLEQIPADPESIERPKRKMVDIARRSRQRAIQRDMAPAVGTTAEVGPAYVSRVSEFARDYWRPNHAANRSESLRSCITALESLGSRRR